MSRSYRRFRRGEARNDPLPPESGAEEVSVTIAPLGSTSAELAYLAESEVISCEPIGWGSNYSFAAVLRRGEENRIAVYKPRRGEVPLWDFPDGTLYRREYAAYLVTQALGWKFIPTTIVREGPHGVGTMQIYVHHNPKVDLDAMRKTNANELLRVALFDVFANNADRKTGHCLQDYEGKLWGIDHGLTFNVAAKLRTVIWDFCGKPIPEDACAEMEEFLTDQKRVDELNAQLSDLLDPSELRTFYARFERLLRLQIFPDLDPYRNVPRGWW